METILRISNMTEIKEFVFNPFQENTLVLFDETNECIIIDPGCFNDHEKKALKNFIEEKALKPVAVILTHGHVDHICGTKFCFEEFGLAPECHKLDHDILNQAVLHGKVFGLEIEAPPTPGNTLKEGDKVLVGNTSLSVIHVPGHTRGSIALFRNEQKFLITGDVLFNGGIGRTDLPGGNYDVLMNSIKDKLLPLGDEVKVYSGHGPSTSLGEERRSNPFIKDYFNM